MAAPRHLPWYLAYLAGWVVGTGVVGVLLAATVGELLVAGATTVDPGLVGAALGIGTGLLFARGSAGSPMVHRRLLRAGGCLCLALPLAAVMWWWSEVERTSGMLSAGFIELMLAYLCLILGVAGAAFVLAGVSGQKLTTA